MIRDMKRQHELVAVLSTAGDYESEAKREEIVKKLVGDSVTINSLTLLGKKPLSFPIKKQTEGIYVLAAVSGVQIKSADIQKRAAVEPTVLRVMLTA